MELDLAHEETPSWLSIITKAKRFPILNFNPGPSRPQQEPRPRCHGRRDEATSERRGLFHHVPPKKNRSRLGPSSSMSIDGPEEDRVQISVMDLTSRSSSSSSPSPGLRSCGSASSAEDDTISTASTCPSTLSASPGLTGEEDCSPNESRRFPCGSNQISVIRSTSSFLRIGESSHPLSNPTDHDEPQDLSLKPKRLLMPSEMLRTEEKDCVQDLRIVERHKTEASFETKAALRETVHYATASQNGVSAALTGTSAISKRDRDSSVSGNHTTTAMKSSTEGLIRFSSLQCLQDRNGVPSIVRDESIVIQQTTPILTPSDLEPSCEVEVKQRRGRKRKEEEPIGIRFDCFMCNFTCVKETLLKNHMTRMHTVKGNRGNVKCTVCGYSAVSLEELRSHQGAVHSQGAREEGGGTTEPPKIAFHACSHCTKKFRSQSQLEAHLRLIAQKQLWKDLKTRRMMS